MSDIQGTYGSVNIKDRVDLTKHSAWTLRRAIYGCCVGAEAALLDGGTRAEEDVISMLGRIDKIAEELYQRTDELPNPHTEPQYVACRNTKVNCKNDAPI